MDLREKVGNNLATAKRMLAGLILKQKEEIKRLEKVRKEFNSIYDDQAGKLNDMDSNNDTEGREAVVDRVQDLQSKISATDEAIAQYKMNLRELGHN